MLAVRARALIEGRVAPSVADVVALAEPVLKHRMALTFSARADGETVEERDSAPDSPGSRVRPRSWPVSGSSARDAVPRPSRNRRCADLAQRMPRLVLEARRVAATLAHGIHGRRRAGAGESFWQFRPFVAGEAAQRDRLAPIGARRPAVCARARMGDGPHGLALARSLRLHGLRVRTGAGAQDRARPGPRPGPGRHLRERGRTGRRPGADGAPGVAPDHGKDRGIPGGRPQFARRRPAAPRARRHPRRSRPGQRLPVSRQARSPPWSRAFRRGARAATS